MIQKDLNRRLLLAHFLSKKKKGPDAAERVADACCGIQSQDIRQSLSSFWARIDGFRDADVLSELKPGGGLVRTWAVRYTMYTIPSKDYHVYILGGAAERALKWLDTIAKKRNYPPREQRSRLLYEPFLNEVKGRAFTEKELRAFMQEKARRLGLRRGIWTGLGEMAFQGLLVHAGKQGSNSLWMRSEDWIPRPKALPDRQDCRVQLVRKYIGRHGPVSKDDIMYWAYLSKEQLEQALTNLEGDLVEVKIKGSKEPYLDLDRSPAELPPPPEVILLPKYDSLLLSLKDKSRFMDMANYKRIFPKIPVGMVKPTFLLDGFVAGTWRRLPKKKATSIEVEAFKKISTHGRRAVEERFSDYCNYAGFEGSVRWVAGS